MGYLKIENQCKAIPSVEALRMLGVSFSRGNDSSIGQFGSGFPASLALLARAGLLESVKLCLGKEVYTFCTVGHSMRDANGNWTVKEEIRMKRQNGASWDLNISTEFGAIDWTDETMAIREFLSNALDGADQFDGTYSSFRLEDVGDDPKSCRAKDGFIRVYIKMNSNIEEYVRNIDKYFICTKSDYDPSKTVLANTDGGPARIYRKGVLVGEFGERSLFHYNLPNIQLKESRVVDSSEAASKAARAISVSEPSTLQTFIKAVNGIGSDRLWENNFSTYSINVEYNYTLTDQLKAVARKNWKTAIDRVMGGSVICETATTKAMIEGKGLTAFIPSSSAFGEVLKAMGAPTSDSILNKHEIEGKVLVDPTDNVIACLDSAWRKLESLGMTAGKEKPKVMGFHQNGASGAAGYYIPGEDTIFIRSDFSEDRGLYLLKTVIEECAHYITQAKDCTRDFQEFAFKVAANAFLKI